MKVSWKIWVTFLLSIAGILLLCVLYLMYQREVLLDSIEVKADKYLSHVEHLIEIQHEKLSQAKWNYNINSTNENWENLQIHTALFIKLIQEIQYNLTIDRNYTELTTKITTITTADQSKNLSNNNAKIIKRKFDIILKYNCGIKYLKLPLNKYKSIHELLKITNEIWDNEVLKIKTIEQNTKIHNKNLSLISSKIYYEYDLQLSTNYWLQFHDEMSSTLKTYLKPFIQLLNENVLINKYSSYKDFLLATEYELNIEPEEPKIIPPASASEDTNNNNNNMEEDADPKFIRHTNSKLFINHLYDLWYNLKPLYDELHAYVRAEINDIYGLTTEDHNDDDNEDEDDSDSSSLDDEIISGAGVGGGGSSRSTNNNAAVSIVGEPITEQFFGFIGTNDKTGWLKIYNITKPYSTIDIDPDEKLTRTTNYDGNVLTLIKLIEDYLIQLEFPQMDPSFWTESLFGNVDCNISCIYESNNWNQLKIAICNNNNNGNLNQQQEIMTFEKFKDSIRLMVRIKFQMVQKDQPFWFRKRINDALQRGIEEAIVLAMTRPAQLAKFGFIDYVNDMPSYLNHLYKEALMDLPIMIQALATFRFSLELFASGMSKSTISNNNNNNLLTMESLNRRWWMLRQNLVGIKPPQSRLQNSYVDFTSILTIDKSPLEDYITIVLKYQIYKALCIWNLESDGSPEYLETCDITNNGPLKDTKKLVSTIALGSSKSWVEILKFITNSTKLDTDPMVDYFEPLHEYLEDRNERRGLQIGWPRLLRNDPMDIMMRSQSSQPS